MLTGAASLESVVEGRAVVRVTLPSNHQSRRMLLQVAEEVAQDIVVVTQQLAIEKVEMRPFLQMARQRALELLKLPLVVLPFLALVELTALVEHLRKQEVVIQRAAVLAG